MASHVTAVLFSYSIQRIMDAEKLVNNFSADSNLARTAKGIHIYPHIHHFTHISVCMLLPTNKSDKVCNWNDT